MNDEIREQISALADDELSDVERPLLLSRLERDPRLAGCLGRYQLIGEVMRGSGEVATLGVAERVQKGGHDVPEEDIRRRFTRSAGNFWNLYRPLCDRWLLMYNGGVDPSVVATGDSSTHSVQDDRLFHAFLQIAMTND